MVKESLDAFVVGTPSCAPGLREDAEVDSLEGASLRELLTYMMSIRRPSRGDPADPDSRFLERWLPRDQHRGDGDLHGREQNVRHSLA